MGEIYEHVLLSLVAGEPVFSGRANPRHFERTRTQASFGSFLKWNLWSPPQTSLRSYTGHVVPKDMMCVPQLVENTHAGLNFHFYVFTIGLGQMEESAKFISKKGKDRFHPKRCTRGLFCHLCPCDLGGGTKTSLLPPSNWKPFYWKNALYDEDEIRKIIIIMMFGSMRLSAWKHNKSPCKQRGKLPTKFSCSPGGLGKSIASPST